MKFNCSLKQIWTFIVLISVITPVLVVMGWYGSSMYKYQLNSALTIEKQTNEILSNQISSNISRYKTIIINKSEPIAYLLNDLESPSSSRKISKLLRSIIDQESAIHKTLILSLEGNVIIDVDPQMGNFGDRPLSIEELHAAAERAGFNIEYEIPEVVIPSLGRSYIGSPKRHDGKYTFNMSVPIGAPAKAVLVVIIDIDELWVKQKTHSNNFTQNYIIDRRGALVTEISNSSHKSGDLMTHYEITRTALIHSKWPIEKSYVGVLNNKVYGTITTIPNLSWTLVSEVDAASIIAPIKKSLQKIFILTLFGLVFFVLAILYLSKKTLRPIQQASKAIDKFACGDYSYSLNPTGITELDTMTTGIINMRNARKESEYALEFKEKEQREMLNSMFDAVISINEKGIILSFNKAAIKLFGYTFEEVKNHNVTMLMPEPFASEHGGYIQNYLNTHEEKVIGLGREVIGLHKDGHSFPMRLFVAELSEDIDGHKRFIGSCVDLTHIKQQEEQLRRSQKMEALGKLTGGIAHDYNNMLGVVSGYAELLENALKDQPKLSNYAQRIIHASERGSKLTKKLLGFSKQQTTDAEPLNINILLTDMQHMLEKTLTVRVNLTLKLSKNLWSVYISIADMEDVILNMAINAMHAIEGNGTLTIQTHNKHLSNIDSKLLGLKSPGDYITLHVSDTGCGMTDTVMERIFDPFYSTKGDKGTGLGLSQAYGFIERCNGTVKVYSEIEQGSEFVFYFPRYIDKDDGKLSLEKEPSTYIDGHESILLVDDEPDLLNLSREILIKNKYHVFTALNGKEALDILEMENINLMISDVVMPKMDGFQLADIVKKKYPHVKVQLASGFTDKRHSDSADKELQKNLLHKPFNSNELLTKIRNLLNE